MKYQINRVLCASNGKITAYNVEIPTEDIEQTRAELHEVYLCERISFEYEELA